MTHLRLKNVGFSYPIRISQGIKVNSDDDRIELGIHGRARRFQVLRDLTFNLEVGDRVAIIGRNGSGKSTLLRLLHGALTPETGTLQREGKTDALFELNLGIRPQASGYQNIFLGGLMRGYTKPEIETRLDDVIGFADIGDFIHLPMETYSAGMRMRLLFALATTFEPEILLLDEWVSAGDAQFRKRAQKRMNDHVEKAGILVLASHSATLLRDTCNRALWLERGRIVAFGDLEPVFTEFDAVIQKGTKPLPS